jgi:MerR family redox-sensitive transcriptional activator SoxR
VATSALRYYESLGLIESERTDGNQRRFESAQLRRIAVIRAAQELGISLAEVGAALDSLPGRRTPRAEDWAEMSRAWRDRLDARIAYLERLRDDLDGCIGCGCLSLKTCAILNQGDRISARGPGARFLLGDPKPRG